MKALNLKNISWSLIVSAIVCMVAFTGCSDDDEEGVVITFPELKEEVYVAGETVNISFNAAADWQLTSKASWCKFVNGDFKETIARGKAGEQTIKAEISDEGLDYNNDNTTEIVLKVGAEEQVIYKITRSKKAFGGLVVKSVPEAEGEEAVIYSEGNPIVVKGCDIDANRDGYLLIETSVEDATLTVGINEGDNPNWVNVEKVAEGFKFSFNRANAEGLKFNHSIDAENGGNIKFSVMASDNSLVGAVSIPVAYEGLKEGVIEVEPAFGNLSVSTDGLTFTEISNGMSTGGSLKKYEEELVSTITTRDDKFHIVKGSVVKTEYLGGTYYMYDFEEVPSWVNAEVDGTKVTVIAGALMQNEQRGAIVMALPEQAWENVKDDLNNNLIDVEDLGGFSAHSIALEYSNGVMAVLIQEPEKQAGEKITFKGFYLNEKVDDWSKVTASQLEAFDDDSMMEMSKEDIIEAGYEPMANDNFAFASASLEVLKKGGSICILVENVPDNYMISPTMNPWMDWNTGDTSVEIEERRIEGKRYAVLTGVKENIPEVDMFSIIVGDFDMMEFAAECIIGLY